ncbi:MAG: cytochrome c oxidase subunit 3 [Nitrosomonadales bacterium]|jgi:cytochrome c oxidase subunit 3
MAAKDHYYVPEGSKWPIVGSFALFTLFVGAALFMSGKMNGNIVLYAGVALVAYMFIGWFNDVIGESHAGKYNDQVDVSFRMGMGWFIFSEVMFFAAFFGALFYTRIFSVPWLGGVGHETATHQFLWSAFEAAWPLNVSPDLEKFPAPKEVIPAFGVPAVNTLILLTSGVTVTFAHWALKKANRGALNLWLAATVLLGFIFVYFQAGEYGHAYHELNLKLSSGIYGSTFYLLTGFHGFHVTMGAIMLLVILLRCMKGHFSKKDHFAFEAVAWYWHFVDVVWLGLFIFVYWI